MGKITRRFATNLGNVILLAIRFLHYEQEQ